MAYIARQARPTAASSLNLLNQNVKYSSNNVDSSDIAEYSSPIELIFTCWHYQYIIAWQQGKEVIYIEIGSRLAIYILISQFRNAQLCFNKYGKFRSQYKKIIKWRSNPVMTRLSRSKWCFNEPWEAKA